jgi:hypothetical protein
LSSSSSSILLLSFQGEKASSKDAKDVDKNHDQSQSDSGVQRDLFEENFKELQRWVDVNSSKYGTLLVLRERRSGRLGTALKVFSSFLFIYCVWENHDLLDFIISYFSVVSMIIYLDNEESPNKLSISQVGGFLWHVEITLNACCAIPFFLLFPLSL